MMGARSCAAVLFVAAVAAGAACPLGASAAVNGPLVVVEDFVFDECPQFECATTGQYSLWVAFPGGGFRELTAVGRRLDHLLARAHTVEPEISPDGRWLVFGAKRPALDLARVNLRADKVIARRTLITLQAGDYVGAGAWSPDSRRLAILGQVAGHVGLFVVDRDGAHLRRLVCGCRVKVPSFSGFAMTGGVAWSARGQLAFVGSYANTASIAVSLYLIGDDGAGLRNLVAAPRRSSRRFLVPAFSPDGRQLIYQPSAGKVELSVRDLRSGRTRALALDGDAPAFSPDGRQVAVSDAAMDSDYTLVTWPRSPARARCGCRRPLTCGTTPTSATSPGLQAKGRRRA
jgi:Tol biopolymer transport system component